MLMDWWMDGLLAHKQIGPLESGDWIGHPWLTADWSFLCRKWPKSTYSLCGSSSPSFVNMTLWLSTETFIISLVVTSQPGASTFPSFLSDSSQLHKPMKEEHLATRTFFVFVTVSQLNLNHSVLALSASALDGSVPYVPMNAAWICVQ